MKLDMVHDIQHAFRNLVDGMSRPGFIITLERAARKVDLQIDCLPATVVLALMLLDTEVTFKVFSEREEEVTIMINQLTYAKAVEAEKADFIFVLQDAEERLEDALDRAKIGDLVNPHESATIIVETDAVSNGDQLVLKGPGIEYEQSVQVQTKGKWTHVRNYKNAEFPLGIDLIFVDPENRMLCLPRTTQIVRQVG